MPGEEDNDDVLGDDTSFCLVAFLEYLPRMYDTSILHFPQPHCMC